MKLMITTAALLMLATSTFAETIAGGNAANCADKTGFYHPIVNGAPVSYWNNATCKAPDGGATLTIDQLETISGTDIDQDGDIGGEPV